jgi:microcystin-dependent protein
MAEPFLGQIMLVPYNFAPRGWAFCAGQILPISQNSALFSLLGTSYGGNGTTTFALPDLRGRVAVGVGQGPGLSPYNLGQQAGAENVTLLQQQMPIHNHVASANNGSATATRPAGTVPAGGGSYAAASDGTTMNPTFIQNAGGSQPHNNIQPFLGLNYIIALTGVFPSRN